MEEPQGGDSVLVLLARIDEKLTAALATQTEHATDIKELQTTQGQHGNRITALETASTSLKTWVPIVIATVAALAAIAGIFIPG